MRRTLAMSLVAAVILVPLFAQAQTSKTAKTAQTAQTSKTAKTPWTRAHVTSLKVKLANEMNTLAASFKFVKGPFAPRNFKVRTTQLFVEGTKQPVPGWRRFSFTASNGETYKAEGNVSSRKDGRVKLGDWSLTEASTATTLVDVAEIMADNAKATGQIP